MSYFDQSYIALWLAYCAGAMVTFGWGRSRWWLVCGCGVFLLAMFVQDYELPGPEILPPPHPPAKVWTTTGA